MVGSEVVMTQALQVSQGFTYSDYQGWPDSERWEIIDGQAFSMTPAPSIRHQKVSSRIYDRIRPVVGNGCDLFYAPCDVVLDEENVVQPDLFIVCDQSKIGEQAITGAPDVVFEISSPSTASKDRTVKYALYERFGVKEYVLIHPSHGYAEVFRLNNHKYANAEICTTEQTLSITHPAMEIHMSEIFEQPETKAPVNKPQVE